MHPTLVTAADVNPDELHAFLMRFYPPAKCEFLQEHGEWWHGNNHNRWVLLLDDKIAGYCSLIPTRVLFRGEVLPAIWWVDLLIASEFRGMRLQSIFDQKLKEMDILKLGFPNLLAAKIHAKHGWEVRDDLQVLLFPLRPLDVNQVRSSTGWRGRILRIMAAAMLPGAWIVRQRLKHYRPSTARQLNDPSPEDLSAIFSRVCAKNLSTTYRDVEYFQRRFFSAPYRNELSFYVSGDPDQPTQFLVARRLCHHGRFVSRILDLYGNFDDQRCIKDLILLMLRDAVLRGDSQVTILVTQPWLQRLLFGLGFFFRSQARFCWLIESKPLMNLPKDEFHWTLADSDNDEVA